MNTHRLYPWIAAVAWVAVILLLPTIAGCMKNGTEIFEPAAPEYYKLPPMAPRKKTSALGYTEEFSAVKKKVPLPKHRTVRDPRAPLALLPWTSAANQPLDMYFAENIAPIITPIEVRDPAEFNELDAAASDIRPANEFNEIDAQCRGCGREPSILWMLAAAIACVGAAGFTYDRIVKLKAAYRREAFDTA